MKKSAFVTGGAGFLGHALVALLLERGWAVTVLGHVNIEALKQMPVTVVPGDLTDIDLLARAIRGCHALFHLAAVVSFKHSDRERLQDVNVKGTINVLKAARSAGVQRAVLTSSACTLGTRPAPEIVDETIPCLPEWRTHNVYLDSKAAQEEVAQGFSKLGLETVVANPSTVFGPGDWAMNSGTIIKVVKNGKVVPVSPGGTSTVDVADVAEGHLAAFEKGRSGERYVLTNENLTFAQLYEAIASVLGRRPLFVPLPKTARPILEFGAKVYGCMSALVGRNETLITPQIVGDTFEYKWYSNRKAQVDLEWKPQYSLSQSVERALRFYRDQGLPL